MRRLGGASQRRCRRCGRSAGFGQLLRLMTERRLLFKLADPILQPVAIGRQLLKLLLPLVEFAGEFSLFCLLPGKLGLGFAEPRGQGGPLRLGNVQRAAQLRDLVVGLCRRRRFGRGGSGSRLRPGARLFNQSRDPALCRRQIAAVGGHLVAQPGKIVLQIYIGRLDAACRRLGGGGMRIVADMTDRGHDNRNHGDRHRRSGQDVEAPGPQKH